MSRQRILSTIIAASAVASVALVAAVPIEEQLGQLLKLVLFHGASTWVNLVTFTGAAVLGAAYLASGRDGVYRWGSALRYLSAPWWAVNTALGVASMRLAWGGFDFSEPRMLMTLWILIGAFIVLAVEQVLPNPRIMAALDLLVGVALWVLLLATPKVFHPDNPVLNTGGLVLYLFAGMVVALAAAGTAIAVLLRRRMSEGPEVERV